MASGGAPTSLPGPSASSGTAFVERHSETAANTNTRKRTITRVRTGCITCRHRRKKCDERKTTCLNCEKANIVCEGYTRRQTWQSLAARKKASDATANIAQGDVSAGSSPSGLQYALDLVPPGTWSTQSQTSQAYAPFTPAENIWDLEQDIEDGDVPDGTDLSLLYQRSGELVPWDGLSNRVRATNDQASVFDNYQSNTQPAFENSGQYFSGQVISWMSYIPRELPFPVKGITTPIHQQLFSHFTNTMADILSTFADGCNPFNAVVIPLALEDTTVMNTLLSLAGSHLLKAQNIPNPDPIIMEQRRLHLTAIQTQSARIDRMRQPPLSSALSRAMQNHEAALASSLLLCLYDICEGTGTDSWRVHLEMASEVIAMASEASNEPTANGQVLKTEINPFLLEFFLYHNCLAAVTVPTAFRSKPHFHSLDRLPVQNMSSLVGVQDGLMDFIERISLLRSEAEQTNLNPDGNIVSKAVAIWRDLYDWKPNPGWSEARQLITTFYREALSIWLFSILHPNDKDDPSIQKTVRSMSIRLGGIKPEDGVMACLLFPLFVVATSAITQQDRDSISAHFMRLKSWSSLGNVDLTYQIVRKMWNDHDNGIPGSWDWVQQLKNHKWSFMVT